MYPFESYGHHQLLNLAHRAAEAAHDHNSVAVATDALELFLALTDHVLAERPAFFRLAPRDSRILCRGQERISDLLLELATSAAQGEDACGCGRIADDVVAELEIQAADEHRYLLAVADGRTDSPDWSDR